MLAWMLHHTRDLYLFKFTPYADSIHKDKPFILWLCIVGCTSSLLSGLSFGLFSQFAAMTVYWPDILTESFVRHFFVGTLLVLLCERPRITTIACLMLAVQAAALCATLALPALGAPASAAFLLAFSMWTVVAFFNHANKDKLIQTKPNNADSEGAKL